MANRFYTLTLNPALDRTMYFDTFRAGELNRAVAPSCLTLGSKGINVSRFLAVCGETAPAYGFCGGQIGAQMCAMLRAEGLETRFTPTAAETRLNVKMICADGTGTEANERGGPMTESETSALTEALLSQIRADCENSHNVYLFLGGSIPPGVDKSVYKFLVEKCRDYGAVSILDADGQALKTGMEALPSLIKPNLFELSQLCGKPVENLTQARDVMVEIYRASGVEILCTAGGEGACFMGAEGFFRTSAPAVTLRGFTGAGDTALAAFVLRRANGADAASSLAFAVGAASAKVQHPGSEMPSLPEVASLAASRTVVRDSV